MDVHRTIRRADEMADTGRERTIRFRAPESGKPTFVVTRKAAAPDPKQTFLKGPFPTIMTSTNEVRWRAFWNRGRKSSY